MGQPFQSWLCFTSLSRLLLKLYVLAEFSKRFPVRKPRKKPGKATHGSKQEIPAFRKLKRKSRQTFNANLGVNLILYKEKENWELYFPHWEEGMLLTPYLEFEGWFSRECLEIWRSGMRTRYLGQTNVKKAQALETATPPELASPWCCQPTKMSRGFAFSLPHRNTESRGKERSSFKTQRKQNTRLCSPEPCNHGRRSEFKCSSEGWLSPWSEQ